MIARLQKVVRRRALLQALVCRIAGILSFGPDSPRAADHVKMISVQDHRGPDGWGVRVLGA